MAENTIFERCLTFNVLQKRLGADTCDQLENQFNVSFTVERKVYDLVENIRNFLKPYVYDIKRYEHMEQLVTEYFDLNPLSMNESLPLDIHDLMLLVGEPITFDVNESYLPVKRPHSNASWLKQVENRWGSGEHADLSGDRSDFEKLSVEEKRFLLFTLAFFAKSDIEVLNSLNFRYLNEIKALHICMALSEQGAAECTHILSYAYQIESLISDEKEKAEIFEAIDRYPIVQEKIRWVRKYVQDPHMGISFVCLIQMCMEAIYFSSSFASIFWFRKKGLMNGVAELNGYIVRDEFKHCEQFANIYNACIFKVPREYIVAIFSEAVEIECRSVEMALPDDLFGMSKELMKQHVKATCDTILPLIGEEPIYNVVTPFEWYKDFDNTETVTNFFERPVTDYNTYSHADFMT